MYIIAAVCETHKCTYIKQLNHNYYDLYERDNVVPGIIIHLRGIIFKKYVVIVSYSYTYYLFSNTGSRSKSLNYTFIY